MLPVFAISNKPSKVRLMSFTVYVPAIFTLFNVKALPLISFAVPFKFTVPVAAINVPVFNKFPFKVTE